MCGVRAAWFVGHSNSKERGRVFAKGQSDTALGGEVVKARQKGLDSIYLYITEDSNVHIAQGELHVSSQTKAQRIMGAR